MPKTSNESTAIVCPECKVPIPDFALDSGNTLNYCTGCKGTWFDPGELASETGWQADLPDLKFSLSRASVMNLVCPNCADKLFVVPFLPGKEIGIGYCKRCLGTWVHAGQISEIRLLRGSSRKKDRENASGVEQLSDSPTQEMRFSSRSLWVTALALPVSLLFYLIATKLIYFAPWFLIPLQFHELGHAVHAWLGSRFALPAFYGETVWALQPNFGIFFMSLVLNGFIIFWCGKQQKYFPVLVSIAYLVVQTGLSFLVSEERREGMAVYGGCGGHIWLSGLLILSFYYDFPDRIRWDFWRLPAIAFGTFAFCDAVAMWFGISSGTRPLPRGSMLQGAADKNGDIDRLIRDFGWSEQGLIHHYVNLTKIFMLVILGHYLYFLFLSWREYAESKS